MLHAEYTDDTWTVRDDEGGRWWPGDEAAEEIAADDDPAAAAIAMCEAEPMRGRWVQ